MKRLALIVAAILLVLLAVVLISGRSPRFEETAIDSMQYIPDRPPRR